MTFGLLVFLDIGSPTFGLLVFQIDWESECRTHSFADSESECRIPSFSDIGSPTFGLLDTAKPHCLKVDMLLLPTRIDDFPKEIEIRIRI